ncbi:hypothetical protein TBLA_0D01620 [Henningerozyma blattae CBS 6284]|uniref:Dynein light chain n=1 Tax=Henningerozyma blattae (strain ATCC 34711 / CBS 6284 / DSM 70876 / NBRC 10599 / NRRL Y-10934 / UCD 77-7) TaxID=1071380 RepID=I2H2R8_HENB6|nr:hypothetical protein TBLA_0D01620 [Tetrapisispora blattae CBS 6284]CCH60670.1 hypothetical protein TBLA_0D01620 [Tetrapisispora blattae CBS 6284]
MSQVPIVKAFDMPEELKEEVFTVSLEAMENSMLEREIAATIKKELDKKCGKTWHVIVGKNFGSYVTHEKGCFIYYYIGSYAFLVFKSA